MTAPNGRLLSLVDSVKEFYAASFLRLVSSIERAIVILEPLPDGTLISSVPELTEEQFRGELYLDLGLRASAASWGRMGKLAFDSTTTIGQVRNEYRYFQQALQDEMRGSLYFAIDPGKERFVSGTHLFGEQVSERFSSAIEDIEEAGKCLAFARGTACVFHLMRVMEYGLRAVATTLNDQSINPDTNPTWNTLLTRFDGELKKTVASRSQEWHTNEAFFSGVAARLHAVKDAWRNPTMHVRISYTEEQALDIFNNVRGFMQHLATKLRE